MVSNCCGALPMGETHDDLGFCSECKEHATFEKEEEWKCSISYLGLYLCL